MQTKEFKVYDEESLAVRDAYALLTANIHFKNTQDSVKTVTITSCSPQVGKTTTAINLAISMARSGWKTLLVDADLRKPGKCKRLSQEAPAGLCDFIDGYVGFREALSVSNIPNLTYLACGQSKGNPIEQLCSARFETLTNEVKNQFDFVIFDTPALMSVVDGALVASRTDGTLMIAQIGSTSLKSMNRAKNQLEKANANVLGAIMNQVGKREYVKYVRNYDYFKKFAQGIRLAK
ncbi:MAG: CpsD/CapB family tyrosine-protein kinase [Solirubrobacterales bacterium]